MADDRLLREGNPTPGTVPGFVPQHVLIDGVTYVKTGEGNPLPTTAQLTGSIDQVATASQVTVLGGSSSIVLAAPDVYVDDFKKIIVGFNADAAHSTRTALHWQPTGGSTYLLEEILSVTAARTLTNHIEAKGIRCAVQVFNDDTVDHTYDVVVLGVR
jgi:hypothetical protein